MEAVEAELESSEDEDFGGVVAPPPNKRSRFEGSSSLISSSRLHFQSKVKKRGNSSKMRSNGESESSENGEVILGHQNGVSSNGTSIEKLAALKEKNREKIARKKLTKFDEEVVRLIGQHLEKLGLK